MSESAKRQQDLQSRKDKIIAILNNQYDNNEVESESEVQEESEESPRTRLRRKLGATKKDINFYPKKGMKESYKENNMNESDMADTIEEINKRKGNMSGSFEIL